MSHWDCLEQWLIVYVLTRHCDQSKRMETMVHSTCRVCIATMVVPTQEHNGSLYQTMDHGIYQ